MLSEDEVWPILRKQAKLLCKKFPDAHLDEDDLIGEAWLKGPCDVNHPSLAQVKVQRDMFDYVRTNLQLRGKYHLYIQSPDRFSRLGWREKFDVVEFEDLVKVMLDRSNLRPMEKVIAVQVLVEGRKNYEVAAMLGRSIATISISLSRVKQRLKEVCIDLGVVYGTTYERVA